MPFSFSCLFPLGVCGLWVFSPQNTLHDLNVKFPQGENLCFHLININPCTQNILSKLSYQPLASLQISSSSLL